MIVRIPMHITCITGWASVAKGRGFRSRPRRRRTDRNPNVYMTISVPGYYAQSPY